MVSVTSAQVPHDTHSGGEGVTAAVFLAKHWETKHTHTHTQEKLKAPDLLLLTGK